MRNLFALILILFSFLAFPFTSNAQAPQTGKTYYIQSAVSSARYLSTKSGGKTQRTEAVIDQKTSRNQTAMQWTLKSAGDGYYYLIQKASKLALDVKSSGTSAKTGLWIWPHNSRGHAQRFKIVSAGGGYYYLIPRVNPSLRLDVQGGRATAGTKIWTFSPNRTNAQKWKFISTSTSSGSGSNSGAYVRIPKNKITGFANLIMQGMRLRLNNFGPRYRDRSGNVTWYKANDSYIRLGGRTTNFDIPQYTRGVRDKMYFVNDLNLSRASTSFEGNRFVLNLTFEENGTELKGMCSRCAKFREDNGSPDYQINGHTWKVYLKLIPYNNSIAFEVENVRFLGDVDGQGFGELFDGIVQDKLIPIMRREIIKTLNSQRSYIAQQIKSGAAAAGYRFDNVRSVYADGGNVTVLTR
ncbi:MAG: RICIN domain-containing protein [Chitinophagales bacterium]